MHTILIIGGGLVLLAGLHVAGRAVDARATMLKLFFLIWLVVTSLNLWIGVTQAGYSVSQELPIAFVVFAVPALVALLLLRRLRR